MGHDLRELVPDQGMGQDMLHAGLKATVRTCCHTQHKEVRYAGSTSTRVGISIRFRLLNALCMARDCPWGAAWDSDPSRCPDGPASLTGVVKIRGLPTSHPATLSAPGRAPCIPPASPCCTSRVLLVHNERVVLLHSPGRAVVGVAVAP